MPSSTSHLEESGVWCGGESEDEFNENESTSATQIKNILNKHSGGSVDASRDVKIVDVKEIDSSQRHRSKSSSHNKVKRSFRRKPSKYGSNVPGRIQGVSRKRRSSSFSKVFNYNRRYPDVMGRRSSFGIKRMPRNNAVEVDDGDVMWPDPEMFKSSNPKASSHANARRTRSSTTTCVTTASVRSGGSNYFNDTTLMRRAYNFPGRSGKHVGESTYGKSTFSRSITSGPSLASSVIKETGYYSPEYDESSLFYGENKNSFKFESSPTLEKQDHVKGGDIEEMVESINMRNFEENVEKRSMKKPKLKWLMKQLTCLYITTIFFVFICFLLLGLTIWLIQDSYSLRKTLYELKTMVHKNSEQFQKDISSNILLNSDNNITEIGWNTN